VQTAAEARGDVSRSAHSPPYAPASSAALVEPLESPVIGWSQFIVVAALALQQAPGPRRPPQHRPAQPPPTVPADVEPVTTTKSGLKYCVLKAGATGESPRWGDPVQVHYSAWHADGSIIETTRDKQPVGFAVGDPNDGVNEALQLMTAGAVWKLVIPPDLAYGTRGNPPAIQPNETLTFEVELLSFKRGPKMPEFHAGDPAKQKKTESGLIYEPLIEGSGDPPKPEDVLDLRFAAWNQQGRLINSSEQHDDFHFIGRVEDLPSRILQIAPQFMKPGARFRFEAPADLCRGLPFGAPFLPEGSVTIWEIELVSAREVHLPPFTKPDPAQQKTTASGLKYEVLKEGTGETAKLGDKLEVNYIGWFTDGTVFDSSYLSGKPYALRPFQNRGLIQGWIEGLQLMKQGARFRFEIAPNLAYGAKGRDKIPPNSTLVFELELMKLEH
jgi:FKBP-type peptidyl-prolyl cis-trans isomerase